MPLTPLYIALPVATAAGIVGGYAAGGAMKLAIKYFGHEGFVAETSEQRAVRQYTEHAKQGMRE